MIFTADTNLHHEDAPDIPLLQRLYDEGGLRDACLEVDCGDEGHIDRIMVRDGDGLSLEVRDWAVEEHFVDADGTDLSDHPAISAVLGWSSD